MKINSKKFGGTEYYTYLCFTLNKYTMITTEKLIELLEEKFPNAWFKDGGDFSSSNENSVWTGEGSYIGEGDDEVAMFEYHNMSENYQFGAHVKLCRFVEAHGYWVECNDPGTFFIWPE